MNALPKSILSLGVAATVVTLASFLAAQGSPAPLQSTKTFGECRGDPRTPVDADHTPCDGPNSIFCIDESGSYYLVGNISGEAGKIAIEIVESNVTLDLMGFSIDGTGASGPSHGIVVAPGLENISISNGTCSNWTGNGITIGIGTKNCLIDRIQASGNKGGSYPSGGSGIAALDQASNVTVTNCNAFDNDQIGIAVNINSAVIACHASNNGLGGIATGSHSVVENCTSSKNMWQGIYVDGCSVVIGCVANENKICGIASGDFNSMPDCDGSVIQSCTVSKNSCGIWVRNNSTVIDNNCHNNGDLGGSFGAGIGSGIYVSGSGNRIDSNHVVGNRDYGIRINGLSNLVLRNTAIDNPTCNYNIPPGNDFGPIGAANGATSPWANLYLGAGQGLCGQ